ncbi:alpha/beta hydrolase [Mycobacteroides abscessus subsp. bolletii]|nr:alpha/beta hydrolase [Mycobacteroides abscessus]SKF55184.1 alpha/beta hydrolase [Mycobacteroides abscessus subsp. bolletii]SKH03915.1 alpha/beta hydrolase [Mycobacteroides abscessus subsp. bolletii]
MLSLETLRDPDLPCDVTELTTADGARIHVRSYGPLDAPPLVLIHGFACRVEYWNAQINEFADRYRVIAYDQRGFGRSFLGARGVSPEVLGDDLAEVLELTVRGGRRAVLVGHSFGGITIMAWAQRHPGLVCQYTKAVLLTDTVAQNSTRKHKSCPSRIGSPHFAVLSCAAGGVSRFRCRPHGCFGLRRAGSRSRAGRPGR